MNRLRTPLRLGALSALALAAATPAAAQVIDTFDGALNAQHVYFVSGPPMQSLLEQTVLAAVPGGTRRLQLGADPAAPGSTFVAVNGGSELWAFTSGSQRLSFNFAYGTQAPMNLDLSAAGALRLDMYLNTPMKLVIYATTQTTPGQNPDGSGVAVDLPALFDQGFEIPLSAFVTNSSTGLPVNWADVDGLVFALSFAAPMQPSGDTFWARELSAVAVPEPTSAVLLLAGMGGLLVWHRRLQRTAASTRAARAAASPASHAAA